MLWPEWKYLELIRLLWIVMRVKKIECALRYSLPHSTYITPFSAPSVWNVALIGFSSPLGLLLNWLFNQNSIVKFEIVIRRRNTTNNRNMLLMKSRNCTFFGEWVYSERITVALAADEATSNKIAWNGGKHVNDHNHLDLAAHATEISLECKQNHIARPHTISMAPVLCSPNDSMVTKNRF